MIFTSDSPLDLKLTVTSGQLFHWTQISQDTFSILNGRSVIEVNQMSKRKLAVSVTGEGLNRDQLERILGLSVDRIRAFARLEKDRFLRDLIPDYRGLTVMAQSPYECLISFMASAVSNIPRIMRNLADLRREAGTPIPATRVYAFPTPSQITRLGEEGLRNVGLGYRSKYIHLTCSLMQERKIDLDHWRSLDDDKLRHGLMEFPGVGRKIAECVMLFGFSRPGAFPVDVWVRRALEHLKPSLRTVSSEELSDWGRRRWEGAAGLAQQILFCSARKERISE